MNLVRESMIQTAGVLNRRQRDELPVRPLQWHYQNANPFDDTRIVAKGPTHLYVILDDINGKYLVKKPAYQITTPTIAVDLLVLIAPKSLLTNTMKTTWHRGFIQLTK